MQIKIKFFAGIAEATGQREHVLHIEHAPSVQELIERLVEEFPQAADLMKRCMVSLNHDYAKPEQTITENDEIALIPPVSGGEGEDINDLEDYLFEVTDQPLSSDALIKKVSNPYAGAIVSFVGTVREFTHGQRTTFLEYEAYPEMAIKKMKEIALEIKAKWPNSEVAMSHRTGKLDIEEISVIIAIATPHREAGFEAGRYAIERLKQIVPVWKKEIWEDGEEWVGHQEGPWKTHENNEG